MAQQQKELELMILELQDRDSELNSLVDIQQRQAAVWAEDRHKVVELELKCTQLQALQRDTDQELARVKSSLAEMQCKERERAATTHTLQLRLKDMEVERNRLASLVHSTEARVSESRREEARLREKLSEAERDLGEAQRCLLTSQQERDETATELKLLQRGVEEREQQLKILHTQQRSSEQELAKTEEELLKSQQEKESFQTQLIASSVNLEQLKTEVKMAGECDKRKEKLLQLQRSKLERHMKEMDTLKKMCSHHEEQLASLKLQLQGSNLHKHVPWRPHPFPTTQHCKGSEVSDELTELLDSARTGITGFKDNDRVSKHLVAISAGEAPSSFSGAQEPGGGGVVLCEESSAKISHRLCHQTHSKMAVVSPQKLVERGNTMGATITVPPGEEKLHSHSSSGVETLHTHLMDGGTNMRETHVTPSNGCQGYFQVKQLVKSRTGDSGRPSVIATDTSPLSVNLDLLAQEVQDRIALTLPTHAGQNRWHL
jgi:hypothetical protein